FVLPFFEYMTDKLYLTLSGLDFVFSFGIFKLWGLETFNAVSGTQVLTTIQNIIAYIFTFGDSILLLILLSYSIYYIINGIDNAKSISFMTAMIVVLFLAGYFNANRELATSQETMKHIIYFLNHTNTEQLIIVAGTFLASFVAVWMVLSIFINLIVSTAAHTVMPDMESKTWEMNLSGIAFGWTILYSSIALLHPEYSMWAILPAIVIGAWIKSMLSGYSEGKRYQNQRQYQSRDNYSDDYQP
ncbi:MAG TPA: hypothetical protein VN368_02810, partial [Candidatus Methylomirabilis sp.]|nr:hypothetical protein [Candidatus Methylomirabilis sp.]